MADFPLNNIQDSSLYAEEIEDVSTGSKTEGGYVYTRPKFSRPGRKKFKTGFTSITNDEKVLLENFYRNTTKGGSLIFAWLNPVMGTTHQVRFTGTLNFIYKGVGGNHMWDVANVEVQEA